MENNEVTLAYKQFNEGKKYFSKMELDSVIPLCVDFYEGRQWGKIGEKTKKLPRATFNLVEMIVNSKISTMLSSPFKIVFNSTQMPVQAQNLTKFNFQIENEIKFDELCEEMVEQGAVEGCSFVHFYWDNDAIGKRGEYQGGVRAEKIDPLNVVVSNPLETSLQKQDWIIIASNLPVEKVKSMCQNTNAQMLVENEQKIENGKNVVTVFTKYFKLNGEVFFEKSTKYVNLHHPRPLNPEIENKQNTFKASLFPVEVYTYKSRKNCIYGRGEVEPLISNNRTINFNTAMMSKGVEDQGFGTIVQREGALKAGEKITNDTSKVLIDRFKGGQNGFYSLTKQPFSAEAYKLNKDIIETTRSITGVTEVMTGEVMYNNQSGASIAYLQQQAMRPLEKLRKRYKKFRIRCAEIMFQFYLLCYEQTDWFFKEQNDDEGLNNENISIKNSFDKKTFSKVDFDITIEVGATNEYSELSEINLLDGLLKNNLISVETYITLYPDNLLANKQKLINEIKKQKQSQTEQNSSFENNLNQLTKQLNEQSKVLNELKNYLQILQKKEKLND